MMRRIIILLAIVVATLGVTRTASADDGKEIKLGTLAPKDSAWGKVFGAWAKAVEDESKGSLKLTWFYNGSQGDEVAMVGKMRSKQLDGAAITATGLSQIWPHISALQMPGLFKSWAQLDKARSAMDSTFATEFKNQGFVILGTGDVGMAHLMSRGMEVRVPDDLKKGHPFYIPGDEIGKKMLETVGVPAPKPIAVPLILQSVSSREPGAVDIINAPAIAAEQLGWAPHMDHVNDFATGMGIGALVMSKDTFEALPADAKDVLSRTGKNTGQLLTQRIRGIDDGAFNRFKGNKTVVTLNATEMAAWDAAFAKVRASLKAEGKIRGDIVDKVTAAAAN
jgi:TRAP-type C4-dicarboxylate transport system substrate-binding protein